MTAPRTWTGRVFIGASLDGFISRPDGNIDWLTDPAPGPVRAEVSSSAQAVDWDSFFPVVDHLVMGRGTYEKVLSFDTWPYADRRVLVVSSTLDDRITVVRDVDEAVTELAESDAEQVYVDGGKVIQAFLRADLIDEITVSWAPVLIGSGKPLFGDLAADVQIELVASNASASGVVHSTYRVHRPRPTTP